MVKTVGFASSSNMEGKSKKRSTRRVTRDKIGSYNAIVAGGDKQILNLLRKKEESFNYLTGKILKEQQQQKLSAIHFSAINNYLLFAPTMLITLGSAVLSLLIQSPLVPSQTAQSFIVLMITVFQLVLSLL